MQVVEKFFCDRSLTRGLCFPGLHCLFALVQQLVVAQGFEAIALSLMFILFFLHLFLWGRLFVPGLDFSWLSHRPFVRRTPAPGPRQIRARSQNRLNNCWVPSPLSFLLRENTSLVIVFQETCQRSCAPDVSSPETRPACQLQGRRKVQWRGRFPRR